MTDPLQTRARDLIILGGGCAGLSLAARLARQRPGMALTVVEPRARYEEDRTWCGWRIAPHFFSDCVVSQWNKWRIAGPQRSLLLESSRYPYEMVSASLFYEKARASIHSSPHAELLLAASAEEVVETADEVRVTLADGRVIRGPWAVDTRTQSRVLDPPWLWQNFVGYVVHCEGQKQFDSGVPALMEFQSPNQYADQHADQSPNQCAGQCAGQSPDQCVVQFMYTIPFAEDRFLFECTRFSRTPGEEQLLEAALVRWLREHVGPRWRLERREAGSLPMAPPLPTHRRRVIPAGTRGGNMRVSTGYAFHRIQRWADACADSVLSTGRPVPPASNRLLDAMDEMFLRVLQQPSAPAAEIFTDLFASCPTDRLVRFLSGVPRASDLWPVASGLPWGRFLHETPALASGWLRGAKGEP